MLLPPDTSLPAQLAAIRQELDDLRRAFGRLYDPATGEVVTITEVRAAPAAAAAAQTTATDAATVATDAQTAAAQASATAEAAQGAVADATTAADAAADAAAQATADAATAQQAANAAQVSADNAATLAATAVTAAGDAATAATNAYTEASTGIVDGSRLVAETVAGSKLIADTLTAREIAAGAITAAEIAARTITAGLIASGAITANEIAAATITAANIAAGTITATQIAAGTITATELAAGAVTATKLAATAIDGKTITGALIRTASSNGRLELDSTNGLRGFASDGTTVKTQLTTNGVLSAVDATISGLFRTAPTGPRVEIQQTTGSAGVTTSGEVRLFSGISGQLPAKWSRTSYYGGDINGTDPVSMAGHIATLDSGASNVAGPKIDMIVQAAAVSGYESVLSFLADRWRFPNDTNWTDLPLNTAGGIAHGGRRAKYLIRGGWCFLNIGVTKSTTWGANTLVGTLPAVARPSADNAAAISWVGVYPGFGQFTELSINAANGQVFSTQGSSAGSNIALTGSTIFPIAANAA